MKRLPPKLSSELFLDIDYLICRFMKSKKAWKINQNQQGTWFTVKKIKEKTLPNQFHFHIRFNGRDKLYKDDDVIDFDFYINEEQFSKLMRWGDGCR